MQARSHASVIPPYPYYLNIYKKHHQLSSACEGSVLCCGGVIAARLGTDTAALLYFTQHSSGSVVIQQSLSMPDTCWPASDCPSSPLTTTQLIHYGLQMHPEQLPGICSAHMRLLSVCLILCSKITVTTMYLFRSRHTMDQFYDPI